MVTTYTGKMDWQLDAPELRVLGALMEKEKTTPEYYPMSLNALVNAYNNTPRKCLDWNSPAEVFLSQLLHFERESTCPLSRA